ncbi:MAG: AsmA-like C-terminal region-containing protein, partial [Vicinamibacterales bacterium]
EQVGLGRAMPFHSVLTNAIPPGQIDTTGKFGPWQVDDPGATPVTGSFTFADADLSVFKGIGGTLSARGTYGGTLGRIEAEGHTTTPDFVVSTSGQPVGLETTYRAVIDGTNGDTTLDRVEARFLETELVAMGGVYDVAGQDGRHLALDVTIARGRLEDVLRLAVPSPTPTMTGGLTLDARLDLPPGDREVIEKLELDGSFTIDEGRFTDRDVQRRVNTLSGKARDLDEEKVRAVRSDFSGRFQLRDSQLMLDPLRFNVPGALVEMHGSYALRSERLAFAGQLLMDASVSDTVSGWKSLLLKPFDPLFRKDGQTFVPLRISGTRKNPSFGVDVKRIFDKDAPPTPPRRGSSSRRAKAR